MYMSAENIDLATPFANFGAPETAETHADGLAVVPPPAMCTRQMRQRLCPHLPRPEPEPEPEPIKEKKMLRCLNLRSPYLRTQTLLKGTCGKTGVFRLGVRTWNQRAKYPLQKDSSQLFSGEAGIGGRRPSLQTVPFSETEMKPERTQTRLGWAPKAASEFGTLTKTNLSDFKNCVRERRLNG